MRVEKSRPTLAFPSFAVPSGFAREADIDAGVAQVSINFAIETSFVARYYLLRHELQPNEL